MPAATEPARAKDAPLETRCAKHFAVNGLVKTLAYVVCLLFLMCLGLVVQELLALKEVILLVTLGYYNPTLTQYM